MKKTIAAAVSIIASVVLVTIAIKSNVSAEHMFGTAQSILHTHKYVEEIVGADCDTNGYIIYSCSCGDSYVEETEPALGHSYTEESIELSCESDGYTLYTCTTCGHTYESEHTPALEHTFTEWVLETAPSVEEDGIESHYCEVCGYVETRIYICEHTATNEVVLEAANCQHGGHVQIVCEECGKIVEEGNTPPTDHSFGSWKTTKWETPTEDGIKTRTCTVCGSTETQSIVFSLNSGNIYIQTAGIKKAYTVADFTQASVDRYDIVCNYDRLGSANPIILGHSTNSMKYLYNTTVGSYIYFSRNGSIEVYKVIISEHGHETEDHKDIEGYSSGYRLLSDKSGSKLHLYTCYQNKVVKESRWMVVAELVDVIS